MNIIQKIKNRKTLKERVQHLNNEQKRFWFMIIFFIFALVGETGFIVMTSVALDDYKIATEEYQTAIIEFKYGNITDAELEQAKTDYMDARTQYQNSQKGLIPFIIAYVVFLLILLIMIDLLFKNWQLQYTNSEVKKDSTLVSINYKSNRFMYLLQALSSCIQTVNVFKKDHEIIEKSDLFQTLKQAHLQGLDTFRYNSSDFLNEFYDKLKNSDLNTDLSENEYENENENFNSDEIEDKEEKLQLEKLEIAREKVELIQNMINDEIDSILPKPVLNSVLSTENLNLFYFPIDRICRTSDPNIDPLDPESLEKDPLSQLKAVYILAPYRENYFMYTDQRSPIDEEIVLRLDISKNFTVYKIVHNTIGILIDDRIIPQRFRINARTLKDVDIKAMTDLTHMCLDQDVELRDEIADLEIELNKKDVQYSQKQDKMWKNVIKTGIADTAFERAYKWKNINMTTILLLLVAIGSTIGVMFGLLKWGVIGG